MKKIFFSFLLICLISSTSYSQQVCNDINVNATFDSNVRVDSKNLNGKVSFEFEGALATLRVYVTAPKVISYNYKGKEYDAEEYDFAHYKPLNAASSVVTNCLPKYLNRRKYNTDIEFKVHHVFNKGSGSPVTIYNAKEEWKDDKKWQNITKKIRYEEDELCNCNIVMRQLNYTHIKTKIERALSADDRAKKLKEAEEKEKKEVAEFFDAQKEFNKKRPQKKDNIEFFEKEVAKSMKAKASSNEFWEKPDNTTENRFANKKSTKHKIKLQDGKYGVVDNDDNVLIPFKYDNIYNFKNGLAEVYIELLKSDAYYVDECGVDYTYGYTVFKKCTVNRTGKIILNSEKTILVWKSKNYYAGSKSTISKSGTDGCKNNLKKLTTNATEKYINQGFTINYM